MDYNDYIIKSILANNQFEITKVYDLNNLKSIDFVSEQYNEIENLITANNIKAIKDTDENPQHDREYLDILSFKDQNNREYIVTVYDSDLLEQDPQIIEIYQW